MQLAQVITSLRRHWRSALGCIVLVGLGVGAFLVLRDQTREPDRWETSVQLLVPARDDKGDVPEGVPPMLLQGQSAVATSPDTEAAALEAAGLSGDAAEQVKFGFGSNERGDIITLTATAPTRDESRSLADSYASAYMSARRDLVATNSRSASSAAQASLTTLQTRLGEVEAELARLDPELLASLPSTAEPIETPEDADDGSGDTSEGDGGGGPIAGIDIPASAPVETSLLVYERQQLVGQIEAARRAYAERSTEALVPGAYASVVERSSPQQITPEVPSPVLPIAVGLALAALLAVAVPVLLDRVDHSIRDSQDAAATLAAPVLSTIPAPALSGQSTLAGPGTPGALAYRTLATASVATDQLPSAIVVTAPAGRMQDSVAANFAAALADLGLRVALVATQPRQAWYADPAEGEPTLPDFLELACAGRLNGEVPRDLQFTPVENLRVVPYGHAESDALIDGLPPMLRSFTEAGVDVTVIAAPSILDDPSATILAWSTRSVLWVIETGEVTQQQVNEAAAKLELAGASAFGVAVIDGKD